MVLVISTAALTIETPSSARFSLGIVEACMLFILALVVLYSLITQCFEYFSASYDRNLAEAKRRQKNTERANFLVRLFGALSLLKAPDVYTKLEGTTEQDKHSIDRVAGILSTEWVVMQPANDDHDPEGDTKEGDHDVPKGLQWQPPIPASNMFHRVLPPPGEPALLFVPGSDGERVLDARVVGKSQTFNAVVPVERACDQGHGGRGQDLLDLHEQVQGEGGEVLKLPGEVNNV
jgi:hypothetical protein